MRAVATALVFGLIVGGCGPAGPEETAPEDRTDDGAMIEVTSTEIQEGAAIPTRFTCDGEDVSPPLTWSNVPDEAAELVLTVEDPDAPSGTFVHWVVAGIDPATDGLAAGEVPAGTVEGTNDFGDVGYGGPCPPPGDDPHRYRFVIHAIAEASGLDEPAPAGEVLDAIADSTVATGTLTAEYGRAE